MRFTKYKMQQTFPSMKYKRWAVFLKWTKQFAVKAVLPIQVIFFMISCYYSQNIYEEFGNKSIS